MPVEAFFYKSYFRKTPRAPAEENSIRMIQLRPQLISPLGIGNELTLVYKGHLENHSICFIENLYSFTMLLSEST